MFDKLICAISIICLAVVLVLVLGLKDSLRTYFKSLSLGGQVQEVLVLGGHVLVLVLLLGVRSLSLGVRSLLTSLSIIRAIRIVCNIPWKSSIKPVLTKH